MTPDEAIRRTHSLLKALGLTGPQGEPLWQVRVVDWDVLQEVAKDPKKDIRGLTRFGAREILYDWNWIEDMDAESLIEHEVAHALSGESECKNNPRFSDAEKRIDSFYRAAEFTN